MRLQLITFSCLVFILLGEAGIVAQSFRHITL